MSGRRLDLVASVDLQPTVAKIQKGIALDFAQYSLLRDAVDAKLYQLMARMQAAPTQQVPDDLRKLEDACRRVAHLLQTSCLALRRLQLDHDDQRLAREALEGQLAYMQACLRRSLASFDDLA